MLSMLKPEQGRAFVSMKNMTQAALEIGTIVRIDDRDVVEYSDVTDRVLLMNRGFMGRVDERIKPQHYGLVELILD